MRYYDNWKTILAKAWSIRFMALAFISNGALMVVSISPDVLPKSWYIVIVLGLLSGLFNVLAIYSRVAYQKALDGNNK